MKNFKFIAPLFSIVVIFLFYVKKTAPLKFYPPVCNFIFFLIFFLSLFKKETIIQKIARKTDGVLSEKVKIYTRNLTYLWTIFTFFNFSISLWTVFLKDEIWAIYNGIISYFLVGIFFMTEYIVRIILKRRRLL